MSNNNVQVNFRVSGGELSSYIDKIKQKQQQLSDEAVSNVTKQNVQLKEQQKLIQEQVNLIEKKNKLELQAERNILIQKRKNELRENDIKYDTKVAEINANNRLSSKEKDKSIGNVENNRSE